MAERQLTVNVLDDLQPAKRRKMLQKMREAIHEDRRRSMTFATLLGLLYGTCQCILSDKLNMMRIAAKFVPRLLTDDQKQYRLEISMELKGQK